jgi:hypothetical protein
VGERELCDRTQAAVVLGRGHALTPGIIVDGVGELVDPGARSGCVSVLGLEREPQSAEVTMPVWDEGSGKSRQGRAEAA